MPGCRVCHSSIEPFIDFGPMPLANGFLTPDQFADEYFFDLSAGYCPRCRLVQLVEQPQRERMFNARYPFFTATSVRMAAHFADLARNTIQQLSSIDDPFIVEIGSNDGTLLRHAAQGGMRHLGIEPSASVAHAAEQLGVTTLRRFFDVGLAEEIVSSHGHAHAVIAANALSHVADLHSVVAGIKVLLAPDGICVIEDPYWGDVVRATAFDQIYDEHASYFSASAMSYLFAEHDLTILDASPVHVHGGSMRYQIGHAGSQMPGARIASLIDQESATGLHRPETFKAFRDRVTNTGDELMTLLRKCRTQGQRVVGYGATSKSTTTINFFGITPDLVEFISDTTPEKHGTFTPGAHIPVRPHAEFAARYPDRALLFLWNHAAEVCANEHGFAQGGGRWIVYVPGVQEV